MVGLRTKENNYSEQEYYIYKRDVQHDGCLMVIFIPFKVTKALKMEERFLIFTVIYGRNTALILFRLMRKIAIINAALTVFRLISKIAIVNTAPGVCAHYCKCA